MEPSPTRLHSPDTRSTSSSDVHAEAARNDSDRVGDGDGDGDGDGINQEKLIRATPKLKKQVTLEDQQQRMSFRQLAVVYTGVGKCALLRNPDVGETFELTRLSQGSLL